eukprot:12810818-Ditylum_brightwellii.AAC.1
MLEENEKTIKDAKKNKTYLACGFLEDMHDANGDKKSKKQGNKKQAPCWCQLPNCHNPTGHM